MASDAASEGVITKQQASNYKRELASGKLERSGGQLSSEDFEHRMTALERYKTTLGPRHGAALSIQLSVFRRRMEEHITQEADRVVERVHERIDDLDANLTAQLTAHQAEVREKLGKIATAVAAQAKACPERRAAPATDVAFAEGSAPAEGAPACKRRRRLTADDVTFPCRWIMRRGPRKGQPCGKYGCTVHDASFSSMPADSPVADAGVADTEPDTWAVAN